MGILGDIKSIPHDIKQFVGTETQKARLLGQIEALEVVRDLAQVQVDGLDVQIAKKQAELDAL